MSPSYIMCNARLDEAQAGITLARRNINKLTSGNDITLMTESEEELESLLSCGQQREHEKKLFSMKPRLSRLMKLTPSSFMLFCLTGLFLPGGSHAQKSLVGRQESDATEAA